MDNPNGYHPHYNQYREGILQRAKAYYALHRETIKEDKKRIYYEQQAKKISYQKEYHQKNKERNNKQRAVRQRNANEIKRLMCISIDVFE